MVEIRVEQKPDFRVTGRKTWIGGEVPSNEPFGRFWDECGDSGYLEALYRATDGQPGAVTGGTVLGVSLIVDPAVRIFYYCIGAEGVALDGYESFHIPAGEWAIFRNQGPMPDALVEAEMLAFERWLPQSGLRHRAAPEMEVYLPNAGDGMIHVEFWLPVEAIPQSARPQVAADDRADGLHTDGQTGEALQ